MSLFKKKQTKNASPGDAWEDWFKKYESMSRAEKARSLLALSPEQHRHVVDHYMTCFEDVLTQQQEALSQAQAGQPAHETIRKTDPTLHERLNYLVWGNKQRAIDSLLPTFQAFPWFEQRCIVRDTVEVSALWDLCFTVAATQSGLMIWALACPPPETLSLDS